MIQGPTLKTPRLILRPFRLEDAPAVQQLAGAREIAKFTLVIPHPHEKGMAEAWITGHQNALNTGFIRFAITVRGEGILCGCMGLYVNERDQNAELAYWIGVPFWGQGYCTEAARAVVEYGFESLNLNRIYATPFSTNPASARVMQKIGMTHEVTLRQYFYKWGEFVDAEYYAILKQNWKLLPETSARQKQD